jgi:16S rRNA (adenine1518-N6/adenine1519-N6)-dimethyltransferase
MKLNGLKPNKRLGQNFLSSDIVLKKIIKTSQIKSFDIILEIGPGTGILTRKLAQRAKKVIAVEKDKRLINLLEKELSNNVEIIQGDILKIKNLKLPKYYKLIANLPYYITAPVIRMFLENSAPKLIVLMVQKEVAERICQKPGRLGILSLSVQYFGVPEIVMIVPREKFDPTPDVDSAVIKIVVKKEGRLESAEEKKFFRLVKVGFASPRKTLVNNLSAGLGLGKDVVEKKLEEIGFNGKARAQELSVNDWKKLMKFF